MSHGGVTRISREPYNNGCVGHSLMRHSRAGQRAFGCDALHVEVLASILAATGFSTVSPTPRGSVTNSTTSDPNYRAITDVHAANQLGGTDEAARHAMRIALIGSRGFPSSFGGFETFVRELVPYAVAARHESSWVARR